MKIAFLTLFLGLISGPQTVELSVTGPVARVELLLDGAPVRVLEPPWKARVDFGAALTPHELVARALDDKGGELGRIRQWINLPRPPAEVELVPEAGPTGKVQAVRLSWQSLTQEQPAEVNVTFDGRPLGPAGSRCGWPRWSRDRPTS